MNDYSMDTLLTGLRSAADESYRVFNERLTPGTEGRSIGVRMPVLRKFALQILKRDPETFLEASLNSDIHEINLLHAIVLAALPCTFDHKLDLLRRFVPTIGNWAVCDVLCGDLHPDACDLEPLRHFLQPFLSSERAFEVRFALVVLMQRFHSDEWIDRTLEAYAKFHHPAYYAQMGAAWGLSMLFVHQRDRTLNFLRHNSWDRFTHNRAIQKIIESRQVSEDDKRLVRTLKRPEPR